MAIYTNSKPGLPQPGLDAAREGRGFCRKVNGQIGINAETVLTAVGLLYPIPLGYRDIITCIYAHLNTAADWCQFTVGVTENEDGSGEYTALTPLFRIESPTVNNAINVTITAFNPPIAITRDRGHAWTIRAQTNAEDTSVTFGLNGWREVI